MTTSSTEKELLALLRQRDVDLEERGRLLLKTKVAIEQLQQELSASRKEEEVFKDEARKAYEEQLGQARAIQAQLQLCEEELEARTQDLTRYAADNRNLQLHSAELEAELDSVREEANSRISQLEAAHQDQARLAQHHTSELTTRRKEIEDLQAKLHSRSGVLADHSERAKQLQQERDDSEQLVRELMRKTKKLQEEQAASEQSLKMSAAEVQQAQLKLQQAQAAAEAGGRAAQVAERDWQQRLQQQEQQWSLKQKDLEKRWAARLVEAGRQARAQKAAADEAQQQQLRSLQAHHANHAREMQSKSQQLDRQAANEKVLLQKHWEGKVAEAIKAEQEKATQAEKQWQGRLVEVQGDWQAKLAEGQAQWAQDRAAAEQGWKEAKGQAEQQWKQQLESIQHAHRQEIAAGEAAAAQGRAGVEAKLGALTDRLLHMARKEAKREKRRGELVRVVEELRLGAGAEHTRRRELEAALRESAAIFKRELHDKNVELATLQQQLGTLRVWQGQALESMSQDLSRSMQPSPDFPQDGFQSPPGHYYPHGGSWTRRYHQHGTSPQPQPPQTLRPPTYLRNLASLATPLATPHWMQGGTFQSRLHAQERPSEIRQVPRATSWGQAQPPPMPTNTLASAGIDAAVPRADSWEQAQQPLVPTNIMAASGDAGAVLSEVLTDSRHPQADPLEAEYSGRGSGEVEEQLLLLSSSGVEEEVLECELQALRAARQQLQRASLSQEQLRKSLVARIADKLEEGSQGQPSGGSTRLPSALSPSRSRAQVGDTIPAERTRQEASSWQHMQQPDLLQQPASAEPNEAEDKDSSQLQSWNDELTQRLKAAMGKLQPSMSKPRRSRSRQSRQHSTAAVT
ncbi:hypothetical protein WJX77_003908 [Trebouxia sp. C0004]